MTGISPEMGLVAACCRWPGGVARDVAVRTAAAGVDWAKVVALMTRHRVHLPAFAALTAAGVRPPREVMRRAGRAAALNRRLARESARFQAAFDAAGIAVLIVKGAPLAMLAYGSQAFKQAKDIDFLVSAADIPAALAMLQREGYRLIHPAATLDARQLRDVLRYDREIELAHVTQPGLQIELHWGLSRNPHVLPGIDAAAPAQSVDLGDGQTVRTLRTDDLFAYLCVHGASHGWFRLKWLADLAALVSRHDAANLYRAAVARRVGESAAQALLLAHELLALPLPDALLKELRGSAKVRRMVRAAWALLATPAAALEIGERRFGQLRLYYAEWLTMRDPADARATLAHTLMPTSDVLAVPLPGALHFLYPVLRIPLGIARVTKRVRSARVGGDAR